ncbi:hypothetical protein [Paludifilum halophilum]|uniref:Uncharacterized protein n=1 Tax=Paludifilum halophilum TaxID=1642702 RepID=A0A235B9K1_9BACL|nr:hypothetical protein [Paludifilum halophilum]OYD08902.1 hypothetical protein CHM34_03730 [Paludifilum halophilum]
MENGSVGKISSLLTSRLSSSGREHDNIGEDRPIHRDWDDPSRASLVVLWGLLIYPQLDPDMKKKNGERSVRFDEVYRLFQEHLGSARKWQEVLAQLKKYDYIRFRDERTITAGTRLWTAVDASKMYQLFRTSVLVRQFRNSGTTVVKSKDQA